MNFEPLKSVTIGTFTFEAGKQYHYNGTANKSNVLSQDAIDDCMYILDRYYTVGLPKDFCWEFELTDKKDKYGLQGSITKRISSYFAKVYDIRIDSGILSLIGTNIASNKPRDIKFDVITNLELPAHFFVNSGSCMWSHVSGGRYYIQDTNGGAIRFLKESGRKDSPEARCFFIPVVYSEKETEPSGIALFNNYGSSIFVFAKVLASFTDLKYRRITLRDRSSSIFVNDPKNVIILEPRLKKLKTVLTMDVDGADFTQYQEVKTCSDCGYKYPPTRQATVVGRGTCICIHCDKKKKSAAENGKEEQKGKGFIEESQEEVIVFPWDEPTETEPDFIEEWEGEEE